ncbi:MAG: putative 2-dehydropantoate 2-reductase, partial [Bacteroidales bacterium]
MMKLKYAIIGTGALGGFYGGMLAKAGHSVDFLVNNDYHFVKEHGLKVDSVLGDFHLKTVSAYAKATDMSPVDVVFVCLKTTQNHLLKELLPPVLGKETVVVLLQNGLGVEEDLAKDFPELNIAGGLAFICSNKVGPGHIAHLDFGKIIIGIHQGEKSNVAKQACDDFNQAGVEAEFSDNLLLARWQKLVWNIPFNGTTVVLNTTTDRLVRSEATKSLIYELMEEVVKGANACGAPLQEDVARKMIAMTENMTPYAPSMKIDFDHHRELEIEYIY